MNLSYVTARVSHSRSHCRDGNASSPQGLRRPRFSFFRFNYQTAKTVQAKQSEQRVSGQPPVYPRMLARTSEHSEGNKTTPPAVQGSVAVGAKLIGRARSGCQPPFSKNSGNRRSSPEEAAFSIISKHLPVFPDHSPPHQRKQIRSKRTKDIVARLPKTRGSRKMQSRKLLQIRGLSAALNKSA
jgi:hypothetical protein